MGRRLSSFAETAKEEGFPEIADAFTKIALAEKAHETRFIKLIDNIQSEKVFKKEVQVKWKCGNCGFIHEGAAAPDECPACIHPQAYFELFAETY